MGRRSTPYFRKQTQSWYFSCNGKQINLGKDREKAMVRFHELMSDQASLQSGTETLYNLSQVFLDWCQENRKPGTYSRHLFYLKSFIDSVGRKLTVLQLKPHHLSAWCEGTSWSSTSRNDAIGVVQRMLNWAVEQGYLNRSPISHIKKPRRKRREVVYTQHQWDLVMENADGCFKDFLQFLWITGCRPREARILTANHLHDDLVIFRPEESKGETDSRVIILVSEAKEIVHRLAKLHPTGPVFLNSRGQPWNKDSIKCRLTRISSKVGFRVIAYGARHSFATNALIRSVDTVSLSHLMGHKSTNMLSNYSHLANNIEFLRKQAKSAAGISESSSPTPNDAS